MPKDAIKPSIFIKLDEDPAMMVKALQTHLALEYMLVETPADIVESAIFEMYTRIVMCGALDEE